MTWRTDETPDTDPPPLFLFLSLHSHLCHFTFHNLRQRPAGCTGEFPPLSLIQRFYHLFNYLIPFTYYIFFCFRPLPTVPVDPPFHFNHSPTVTPLPSSNYLFPFIHPYYNLTFIFKLQFIYFSFLFFFLNLKLSMTTQFLWDFNFN